MGKHITQQYADFISLVEIEIRPENKKFVNHFIYTVRAIKILIISWVVIIGTLEIVNIWGMTNWINALSVDVYYILLILPPLCLFLLLYVYRYNKTIKIINILTQDCDVVKFLELYSYLMSGAKPWNNYWGVFYYNLGRGLFAAGRMEDAEKVHSLIAKYCTDTWGQFYYEMIAIDLAGYKKNYEEMEAHCQKASYVQNGLQLKTSLRSRYMEIMQYPHFVQLSNRGEYQELYNLLSQYEAKAQSMAAKVSKNFYLYKIALLLGNGEKAKEHKAFVIQNGGSLWYRSAVMTESPEA